MTEEQATRPAQSDAQYGKSLDMVEETMMKFLQTADVSAAYGMPVQVGDTTIIPTAEVVSVMGVGVGEGSGNGPENMGGGGAGGGGGGKSFSRPVAVIVVSPQGVEVKTVVDITKIALAALTAWGFMIGMVTRMRRRPKLRQG